MENQKWNEQREGVPEGSITISKEEFTDLSKSGEITLRVRITPGREVGKNVLLCNVGDLNKNRTITPSNMKWASIASIKPISNSIHSEWMAEVTFKLKK
jgi:hypothetical protein